MSTHAKITERGYPAEAAANFFIEIAHKKGQKITHLKIQKITYIAHGWCLALLDRPLLDEEPQAWKYGPVIKSLYHALKRYGSSPVTEQISLPALKGGKVIDKTPRIPETEKDLLDLLKKVWDVYSEATAAQLVEATHRKNTPWDQVYDENEISSQIPHSLIAEHYKKLADKNIKKAANAKTKEA